MSTRMDIKSWRKSRNGKAYAIRIGSTWTNDKGVTYLEFDALPLPDEQGRVSCFLEVPRERDGSDRAPEGQKQAASGNGYAGASGGRASAAKPALDDDIPF